MRISVSLDLGAADPAHRCRYGCPRKTDTWQVESLTDSLSAHVASGPGCFMRYSFTGPGCQRASVDRDLLTLLSLQAIQFKSVRQERLWAVDQCGLTC